LNEDDFLLMNDKTALTSVFQSNH